MATKKDIVSKESKPTPTPKPWAQQSARERLQSVGKTVASGLRRPLSKAANAMAKKETYEMKARTNVVPPTLLDQGSNKKTLGNAQLQRDTFTFTSKSGKTQNIEGFHLKAQPGKPTVVYFGGSDFDRRDPNYENAIQNMANRAKEEGCGFAVYDYPKGASEQRIKDWVQQTQDHLEANGVPKNTQAYSGYSLGSFSAAHAANINQDAVGLQITSGFSSARMVQKESMKGMLGKVGSDLLVDKSQLTEVLDTTFEIRQVQQRLNGQHGAQKMPVTLVYSKTEDFGKQNNRHMKELEKELGVTSPGVSTPGVKVSVTDSKRHEDMMKSLRHLDSFSQLVKDSSECIRARQPVVTITPPPSTPTPPVNRYLKPRSASDSPPKTPAAPTNHRYSPRDSLQQQSSGPGVERAKPSVGKKLSESAEGVPKDAPKKGRSMSM
jgi:hypothetical protein